MADAEQLEKLLFNERAGHFKVLAEEYENLASEFRMKAAAARRDYESYRKAREIVFPPETQSNPDLSPTLQQQEGE